LPPKKTFEQAYRFNLFMLKAVLDGRATELVDLARTNLIR
jgi:pyruvate dehydrogenase (quinone)